MNDKNLLFREGNIEQLPLCVKGKVPTTYAVFGLAYGGRACEGCQGQAGISLQRWNLLGVVSLLAKSG